MGLRRYFIRSSVNGVVAGFIVVPFFSLLSKYGIQDCWSLTNMKTRYLSVISDNYTDCENRRDTTVSIGGNMEKYIAVAIGGVLLLCVAWLLANGL